MKQSMDKLSLGGRMKEYYEGIYKIKLPLRMPIIIRLDGKAFHTFTADFKKPFDETLMDWMDVTATYLCSNIQGAQVAYVQSDEISIFVHNYKKFNTQPWFANEIQKMTSISAGMASAVFSQASGRVAVFDSRVFVIPPEEVCNYFIWRQKDWERNSIQMLAQSLYSHKELHKKGQSDMQEMCFQKGYNWNDLATNLKRGRCIVKRTMNLSSNPSEPLLREYWCVDNEIPIFTQDRDYIDKFLAVEEE